MCEWDAFFVVFVFLVDSFISLTPTVLELALHLFNRHTASFYFKKSDTEGKNQLLLEISVSKGVPL